MDTVELLDRARAAFAARAWHDAYDDLGAADRTASLEPADLERMATAAYLTGHDAESTDAWSRAHRGWHERGDEQRAVRCAFWLGFALVQRGEMAQGGGWLARAGRMVEEHELDTVERGYLLVPAGPDGDGGRRARRPRSSDSPRPTRSPGASATGTWARSARSGRARPCCGWDERRKACACSTRRWWR